MRPGKAAARWEFLLGELCGRSPPVSPVRPPPSGDAAAAPPGSSGGSGWCPQTRETGARDPVRRRGPAHDPCAALWRRG
uniref:Uncharacterized protein n=1 Tax=Arundo donax TaxID=35708 RepID=A0A0A8YIC3_ARUDO